MFDAPLWRDYFVTVGGGAAALTGLVFVAMSLHLSDIASDPTHRHRARTILTALTTVFIRCGLVLMGGQSARAVGAELFVVLAGVEVVVLRSLSQALRRSGDAQHEVLSRTLGYAACLIIEQVGAAILTPEGEIFSGCNVENAAYPQGACAEAGAIAAMALAGERRIVDIVVVGDGEGLCTPCGGCRQRIREFADATTRIHVAGLAGLRASFALEELLPHSFGPEHLGR